MMEIGNTIQSYIATNQTPSYRAWTSMMQRIQGVRKVSNVAGAGNGGKIKHIRLCLRMTQKWFYSTGHQVTDKIDPVWEFGSKRH